MTRLTIEEAEKILDSYLRTHYRLSISDVEISPVRGYWTVKKPDERGVRHTISYHSSSRDKKGRFLSPYRVWDVLKRDYEDRETT